MCTPTVLQHHALQPPRLLADRVSMRKDNLIRHMEKCREAASEAPIRLGKRRSRCPKCKEEMHSNKVRGHIEACRVKSVPKPDSIDVRGHDAAIKTGVYVRINSFGEYGLQTDIDDAMKKYGRPRRRRPPSPRPSRHLRRRCCHRRCYHHHHHHHRRHHHRRRHHRGRLHRVAPLRASLAAHAPWRRSPPRPSGPTRWQHARRSAGAGRASQDACVACMACAEPSRRPLGSPGGRLRPLSRSFACIRIWQVS